MTAKNNNYQIINAHAHIYPDKIAKKATQNIGKFYDIEMTNDGSVNMLLTDGESGGISRFLVHSVATTPAQVHSINCFLIEQVKLHKSFIGFGTLHPDMSFEEVQQEIDFMIENGLRGIKLHPDFQTFFPDGARAEKIYVANNGRLPILFHAGDQRYGYSKPERLANVAKKYPKQNIICAHFGGYREWNAVGVYEKIDNVYFDTSSSLFALDKQKAVDLINFFGADRFFFGTDYPMWTTKDELERFFALGLTEEQNRKILGENLLNFLQIK